MKDLTQSNGAAVKDALAKAKIPGSMLGLKTTEVKSVIEAFKPQIAQALPKHISAERIIQIATTLISSNEQIASCSKESLIGALMEASILGFEPVASLGLCYFVPRKNHGKWVIQFQIGYKGYIRLAQNTGEIKTIYANVVREGDQYDEIFGLTQSLNHIPNKNRTGNERITHVYAVVHYTNGGYNFETLTRNEVERYRHMSSCPNGFGWKDHYEAMCKKTAIHRLAKWMPKCIDIYRAATVDGSIIPIAAFSNDQKGLELDKIQYLDEKEIEKTESVESNDPWIKEFDGEGKEGELKDVQFNKEN